MRTIDAFKTGAFAVSMATTLLAADGVNASPADAWAWKHRVLVVFAPDPQDELLADQRQRLAGAASGIAERHLSVIEIVGGEARHAMGASLNLKGSEMMEYVRKKDNRFEVLLLGKDTGIKLRSAVPVSATDVFSLIDTMPMRRQEMQKQGG